MGGDGDSGDSHSCFGSGGAVGRSGNGTGSFGDREIEVFRFLGGKGRSGIGKGFLGGRHERGGVGEGLIRGDGDEAFGSESLAVVSTPDFDGDFFSGTSGVGSGHEAEEPCADGVVFKKLIGEEDGDVATGVLIEEAEVGSLGDLDIDLGDLAFTIVCFIESEVDGDGANALELVLLADEADGFSLPDGGVTDAGDEFGEAVDEVFALE